MPVNQPLCDLVHLSVCFNTLVCLIIYLQQRPVQLVFDSCFNCDFSDVIEGIVCQGRKLKSCFISCLLLLLFLSLDKLQVAGNAQRRVFLIVLLHRLGAKPVSFQNVELFRQNVIITFCESVVAYA